MKTGAEPGVRPRPVWPWLCCACLLLLGACGGRQLDDARNAFYQGRYDEAEAALEEAPSFGPDTVLTLMERGTINQAQGDYAESSADFILASDLLEGMETWSVSQGAGSMLVNDTVQDFSGVPFERTLVHDFTALNHLAQGKWDRAAVEARRIIHSLSPERRGDYPDDAFSRYLAGFILLMNADAPNAAQQFSIAGELQPGIAIDESGAMDGATASPEGELICFFMLGRSPSGPELAQPGYQLAGPPSVSVRVEGRPPVHGLVLADTLTLALESERLDQLGTAAKTLTRIAIKEGIAQALEENDPALGALARIVLIGLLEQPDLRRWETMPRWLGLARLPCSDQPPSYRVIIDDGFGARELAIKEPISRKGQVFFSFFRDIPGAALPMPPEAPVSPAALHPPPLDGATDQPSPASSPPSLE